jgi:hypothetical protein
MHTCDVRNCIRPAHLRLGTIADNNADRDRKGRHRPLRGETNGAHKLTAAEVHDIRRRHATGETQTALAKEYAVTQANVWLIVNRRKWKHAA